MPDLGQKRTDERVDEINKRLLAAYTEAAKDLQKKAEEHTKRYQRTEKRLLAEMQAGKKTQDYIDRWKAGQVFIGKQWQSKVDQMARSLVDTERQAVEIVNGGQLECFADNTNYIEFRIDRDNGFGVNFSLYDETTVKGLIEQEPELMRRRYVDGKACEAWNRKIISNCITQGILQGEKIGDIAKRIARDTVSTDMKAMVRYARTAMTCAQNAGRLQAMYDSKKRGIYCKKVWLAVDDERTREAHSELDGQTAEIDEPFDSLLGEIMYPGDPNASDENVWNCRCALGYEYPDVPIETIDEEESEADYEEWEEEQEEEDSFSIPEDVRDSVDKQSAYDDWFEYEQAKMMAEYIEDGEMPTSDMYHNSVSVETRQRLAAEAEIIQNVGMTTKTEYQTLYRGMVLEKSDIDKVFPSGKTYVFDTLTATTPDAKMAKVYADAENAGFGVPVIVTIQNGGGIYGFKGSDLETILPKGSEFKTERKYQDKDGVYHVDLYASKGRRNIN